MTLGISIALDTKHSKPMIVRVYEMPLKKESDE